MLSLWLLADEQVWITVTLIHGFEQITCPQGASVLSSSKQEQWRLLGPPYRLDERQTGARMVLEKHLPCPQHLGGVSFPSAWSGGGGFLTQAHPGLCFLWLFLRQLICPCQFPLCTIPG